MRHPWQKLSLALSICALIALSGCTTEDSLQPGTSPDLSFEFSVDPSNYAVAPVASNTENPTPQTATAPNETRVLVKDVDLELASYTFSFQPGNQLVIKASFRNITDNFAFRQPFSFTANNATDNILSSTEPEVTDADLGGDGVLSPGETTEILTFEVVHKGEPFSYFVDATADVKPIEPPPPPPPGCDPNIENCNDPEQPKPDPNEVCNVGVSWGDPHLVTFDKLAYDFQAVGEFILVDSLDDDFEVQVRQRSWGNRRTVSVNTAVAMNLLGERIGIYLDQTPALYLNGVAQNLNEGLNELASGGKLYLYRNVYTVIWPDNTQVRVSLRGRYINIEVFLAEPRRGQVTGLLGDCNDDRSNDLTARNGENFGTQLSFDQLYEEYGESWRISQEESLFDYFDGENTEFYTDRTFPGGLPRISAEDRARAEEICRAAGVTDPILLEACILDVAITGDESFAEVPGRIPAPEESVPVSLLFDGWQQQGILSAGSWGVSDDGRSVLQTINGNPTFFVSPESYGNAVIRGTLEVTSRSDDDYIGFVFGYQSPLKDDGDATNNYDFLLFDWKQNNQRAFGGTGFEGFALSRVKGASPNTDFWLHQDTATFEVLATDFGNSKGWLDRTQYGFELNYSPTRIQISIDGELIFDVGGSFPEGRFGFYNYSQANVRYSDFSASRR